MAASTAQAHRFIGPKTLSGCCPVSISADEIARYARGYEYWDADSEIAWTLPDITIGHVRALNRIVRLIREIAKIRGSPISIDGRGLREQDANGRRLCVAKPDRLIYLDHPELPPGMIVVGHFPLPDVVFEVDVGTDVREHKLGVYESWGVPELWVEVPDEDTPDKRQRPGLTIRVLRDGHYQESGESKAFPTWSAREIHGAINEPWRSKMTEDELRRVGEAMRRLSPGGLGSTQA